MVGTWRRKTLCLSEGFGGVRQEVGENSGWEGRGGDQRGADSLQRESCYLRRESRRNPQARVTLALARTDACLGQA